MENRQLESADDGVRGVTAAALTTSFAAGTGFVALAWTTTQAKAVRAASPWQADPYDVMVSFAEFVVPGVLLLLALRMLLWRKGQPQPAFRVAQLVRTATAITGLVALSAAVDWVAVAARADREDWRAPTTPVLIAALAILTAVAVAGLILQRKALRLPESGRAHDADWVDDIEPLAALLTGGRTIVRPEFLGSVAAFARRHDIAVLAAAAGCAGVAVVAAQAVGESWTDPLLILFAIVIATTGFFGIAMLGNHILVFIAPRPRPNRTHRMVRAAVTAAALGMPITVGLRSEIWRVLGDGVGHSPMGLLLLATAGAVAIGSLTFTVAAARTHS
ncbi:hypothetical protein [Nocardia sp. NPDC004722]